MASNNTSKTAHVMNLLSKSRPASTEAPAKPKEEAAVPQTEAAAPQAKAVEPERTAPVAPIISSITADAAVSSQIKDALEAEIETTAQEAAPVQEKAPVQAAAPVKKEAPVQAAAPVKEEAPVQAAAPVKKETPVQATAPVKEEAPVQKAAPVKEEAPVQAAAPVKEEAPVQTAAPVKEEAPELSTDEILTDLPPEDEYPDEDPSYINVMQILVEEKADEYMKMFGICCCEKCRVDVRAFALNHLPPKYVVLSGRERVPRLTVYESRFASDITAQLIQACKQVMITPHHSRPAD